MKASKYLTSLFSILKKKKNAPNVTPVEESELYKQFNKQFIDKVFHGRSLDVDQVWKEYSQLIDSVVKPGFTQSGLLLQHLFKMDDHKEKSKAIERVFSTIKEPNLIDYEIFISELRRKGHSHRVWELMEEMKQKQLPITQKIYGIALASLIYTPKGFIDKLIVLQNEGCDIPPQTFSIALEKFCESDMESAINVFSLIKSPSAYHYLILLRALTKTGDHKRTRELFHSFLSKDFDNFQSHEILSKAFAYGIHSCILENDTETCKKAWSKFREYKIENDLIIVNMLLRYFARIPDMEFIKSVWSDAQKKNQMTYEFMFLSCRKAMGDKKLVDVAFHDFCRENYSMNERILYDVIHAFGNDGASIFQALEKGIKDNALTPRIQQSIAEVLAKVEGDWNQFLTLLMAYPGLESFVDMLACQIIKSTHQERFERFKSLLNIIPSSHKRSELCLTGIRDSTTWDEFKFFYELIETKQCIPLGEVIEKCFDLSPKSFGESLKELQLEIKHVPQSLRLSLNNVLLKAMDNQRVQELKEVRFLFDEKKRKLIEDLCKEDNSRIRGDWIKVSD